MTLTQSHKRIAKMTRYLMNRKAWRNHAARAYVAAKCGWHGGPCNGGYSWALGRLAHKFRRGVTYTEANIAIIAAYEITAKRGQS